jgi:hypothetical protein
MKKIHQQCHFKKSNSIHCNEFYVNMDENMIQSLLDEQISLHKVDPSIISWKKGDDICINKKYEFSNEKIKMQFFK